MLNALDLLRRERRARIYFLALLQSALGSGAGYVALLLVAFDRFGNAWAISAVLLADLLPAMLAGPLLGAVADRWSRKLCIVAADVLRAVAFAGVALVDGFAATFAFALLAGLGTALFTPASLAALPSLVEERRVPAATALFGGIAAGAFTFGPVVAAGLLTVIGPEDILLIDAATFALSAVLLARLAFGRAPARQAPSPRAPLTLYAELRTGLREAAAITGLRALLGASVGVMIFGGLINVAELPFLEGEFDAGDTAFAALVACVGAGFAIGSLAGAGGGDPAALKRRYLVAIAVQGAALLAAGAATALALVFVAFASFGIGNGSMLVHERLIIQAIVPNRLAARVFGLKDALSAWAFAIAFAGAGALIALGGARAAIVVSGAGVASMGIVAAATLRRTWRAGATLSSPAEGESSA